MKTPREYLRAHEIARLSGVSVRTVRRWIAAETLPSTKVGGVRLVSRQALQQMLALPLLDWSDGDPVSENTLPSNRSI
ncbi:helix-turn-helix domain-containing protein [Rhodoblastus sp.]|uniref:helix-turn-helix domain-containing protein n=1 Tax=Rhodoblastus sp. TaxID=1962975 RepID=UPI003F9DF184